MLTIFTLLSGYMVLPRRRLRSISSSCTWTFNQRSPRRNVQTSSSPDSLHSKITTASSLCSVQLHYRICHVLCQKSSRRRSKTCWSCIVHIVDGELNLLFIFFLIITQEKIFNLILHFQIVIWNVFSLNFFFVFFSGST